MERIEEFIQKDLMHQEAIYRLREERHAWIGAFATGAAFCTSALIIYQAVKYGFDPSSALLVAEGGCVGTLAYYEAMKSLSAGRLADTIHAELLTQQRRLEPGTISAPPPIAQ